MRRDSTASAVDANALRMRPMSPSCMCSTAICNLTFHYNNIISIIIITTIKIIIITRIPLLLYY